MKLPEAIALMLEGKVMVDDEEGLNRVVLTEYATFEFRSHDDRRWYQSSSLCLSGWREATPEELKEIGL